MAGLAAAYRLRQAGISVVVLEAAEGPGGRIQTVRHDGYQFDTGADALTAGYTEYLSLLRDVGLVDHLNPLPAVIGSVRNGRVSYMDTASTWSMLTSPILSLTAKLRLAYGAKRIAPLWNDTPLHRMHSLAALDDESCNARVRSEQLFGKEATAYLIDPMVRALGGNGIDAVSWVDVISGLGIAAKATYCLRGGQDILPRTLAKTLDVRYQCRVNNIAEDGSRVVVSFTDSAGKPQSLEAAGCVLATMYEAGVELYAPLKEASRDFQAKLQHMKIGKIQLGYQARTKTGAYVIQVPGIEDPDAMLVFLDHNKCDDRAPAGHSLVSVFSETRAAEKYLTLPDEALIAWARAKAETWFPELAGHFETAQVTRWHIMAPATTPGFYTRADAVLKRLPTQSRVRIACDMFSKTSQEAAAAWGATAARDLIRMLA